MKKYRGDPALLRPPSRAFQCQERIVREDELAADCEARGDDSYDDYYSSVVAFECTVAASRSTNQKEEELETPEKLTFWCREPSCGVLRTAPSAAVVDSTEITQKDDTDNNTLRIAETAAVKEDDGAVDPSFFDKGYTAAGKTGFQVWPGSRLMVEALAFDTGSSGYQDPPALQKWQQALLRQQQTVSLPSNQEESRPLRILELGAGVGVVGASLAAASNGAQVLLTDLPTLVTESLWPNLQRNANQSSATRDKSPPEWLLAPAPAPKDTTKDDDEMSCIPVPRPVPIGSGWVATAPLDWTQPVVDQQLTLQQCQAVDIIIACDCVWLVSMLDGLLNTVQEIFKAHDEGGKPTLLMSFQRRDPQETANRSETCMFTTVDRVINEIKKRQWSLECLAWQPVRYETEERIDDTTNNNGASGKEYDANVKEVFLFEIKPLD